MGNKEQIYGRNNMVMLDKHKKIYGSLGIVEPYVFDTKTGETIVMENPKKGKFEDVVTEFSVYGKSTQQTTKGVNLLNLGDIGRVITSKDKIGTAVVKEDGVQVTYTGEQVTPLNSDIYFYGNVNTTEEIGYEEIPELIPGNYFLYCNDKTVALHVVIYDNGNTNIINSYGGNYISFSVKEGYKYRVFLRCRSNSEAINRLIHPMIGRSKDLHATYEPYTGGKPSPSIEYPQEIVSVGDKGEIGVSVYAENLYSGGDFLTKLGTSLTGYSVAPTQFLNFIKTLKNGTYMIRYDVQTDANDLKIKKGSNFGKIGFQKDSIFLIEPTNTFTLTDEVRNETNKIILYGYYGKDGLSYNELFKNIIISAGEYKDTQTIALTTPNGLPGILSDENFDDWNYINSKGQRWACDWVDYVNGKYIQKIGRVKIDSISKFNWSVKNGLVEFFFQVKDSFRYGRASVICDKLQTRLKDKERVQQGFSNLYIRILTQRLKNSDNVTVGDINEFLKENPLNIMYVLETPIERDLTPEEIQAYKELHTNYPTTVIMNDENVGMKVTYKQLESKTRVVN